MIYAKQSTAIIVTVGPVLDSSGVAVTDGVVGDFKISKNGGAPAALNGLATLTHRNTGHYSLSLTASDVGTVGTVEIVIDDTTNACPPKEIQVVEEAVYDMLFAASALGYVANAPVNVAQFGGSNGTFASGRPEVNTTLIEGTDATDQLAAAAGGGGKVIRAPHLGDIAEDDTIAFLFNTVGANGAPITLAGTPVISVYKGSNTTERAGAEITLTVNSDSRTGTHSVSIDLSADAFYAISEDYSVVITTGTVDSTSVVGAVVGSFSIENRFAEVDVTKLGGGAQSLTDLKDFADDGYDPTTNKVQGVVLTDTVTTYTGNTPQTGDGYAIVNSGTHGNAALKTLIDTIDTVVDAIKVKTDNLPSDPADASVVAGLIAAVQAVVDAIVVDTNELQTDWTDGGRLDLLLDAIKVVTDATNSAQSEPTGVPAANATPLVKLAWLFMALRNKLEITATDKTFYDDGGAAEWKKTLSDDGTTYAESEATTP
jgi:hypothetical protein